MTEKQVERTVYSTLFALAAVVSLLLTVLPWVPKSGDDPARGLWRLPRAGGHGVALHGPALLVLFAVAAFVFACAILGCALTATHVRQTVLAGVCYFALIPIVVLRHAAANLGYVPWDAAFGLWASVVLIAATGVLASARAYRLQTHTRAPGLDASDREELA